MSRAQYSRRVLFVGGLLVAGQLFFVSLPATPRAMSCTDLQRWAVEHYTDARPSLEDMAALDRPRRIAVFNALSPAVRAELWHEQLRRFAQRGDLSPTQQALLRQATSVITPAAYANHPSTERAAAQAVWTRVVDAFQVPTHRQALFDLGSVTEIGPAVSASAEPLCECSRVFNDCGSGWDCGAPPFGCQKWTGCGPAFLYTCNGWCHPLSEPEPNLRSD